MSTWAAAGEGRKKGNGNRSVSMALPQLLAVDRQRGCRHRGRSSFSRFSLTGAFRRQPSRGFFSDHHHKRCQRHPSCWGTMQLIKQHGERSPFHKVSLTWVMTEGIGGINGGRRGSRPRKFIFRKSLLLWIIEFQQVHPMTHFQTAVDKAKHCLFKAYKKKYTVHTKKKKWSFWPDLNWIGHKIWSGLPLSHNTQVKEATFFFYWIHHVNIYRVG